MYVESWMLLVIYIFASLSLVISLWMFVTIEDLKKNGERWIKLNKSLLEKLGAADRKPNPFRKTK